MTYAIRLDARDANGTKLNTVFLRNSPEDADKIIRITESLTCDGWIGRPVILADMGDHHAAFSGSHRLAASIGMEGIVEAVYLPDDLTAEDWDLIDGAHDDEDLMAAFEEIAAERDDMNEIVEAMRAEVDAND